MKNPPDPPAGGGGALTRFAAVLIMIAATLLLGIGCSAGQVTASSTSDPDIMLVGDFDEGFYSFVDANTVRVFLIQGTLDDPQQVLHLHMHWRPRAGRTPVDRTSTNTTVRYIVFRDGEVGVYRGGGFLFPQSTAGNRIFRGQLRHTSVRLMDGTENFNDRLGLARLSGSFNVRLDPAATHRMTRHIEQRLTDRLGYPVMVDADTLAPTLADRPHPRR